MSQTERLASPAAARSATILRTLKIIFGVICCAILANHLWLMSHWSERRGIPDDACYLRQAHLFQQFGLRGLDTNIIFDNDPYFRRLADESGHPEWLTPTWATCHTPMPQSGKSVIQYPPGTGFLLSLFPEGFQFIPLYAVSTFLVFCLALTAIIRANRTLPLLMAGTLGAATIYFMINPTKVSYSSAPTMVMCGLVGLLTAQMLNADARRSRWLLTGAVGLLLGLAVSFRIPNLLLSAGYLMLFFLLFVSRRDLASGPIFGVAYLAGLIPTLAANAINAGSPFATTYGQDASPPIFSLKIIYTYLFDMQGLLVLLVIAWIGRLLWLNTTPALRTASLLVGVNLVVSTAFFLTHSSFAPYYLMAALMASLWTLLFTELLSPANSPVGKS